MKARISLLHKTEAEWNSYANFVPSAGEVIIYDPDDSNLVARLKIGDGIHTLAELEFTIEAIAKVLIENNAQEELLDAGRITKYMP
jgi:hypothetical protein